MWELGAIHVGSKPARAGQENGRKEGKIGVAKRGGVERKERQREREGGWKQGEKIKRRVGMKGDSHHLGTGNWENLGGWILCDSHPLVSLVVLPVSKGYPKGLHIVLSHCPKDINTQSDPADGS